MQNKNIIKTLKSDIQELHNLKYKHNFTRCFIDNKYRIFLNAFITENGGCFNKMFREVQFKTSSGANKLIELINSNLNANLRVFV